MFWYPRQEDYDVRDHEGQTLRDFLDAYDPSRYDHPAVTVDNLIFRQDDDGLRLLLIRRGRHPSFGMLALPGGFIEMDESLEQAAARELKEETGISGIHMVQLGAYGDVGRDPRLRIIAVAFMAIIPEEMEARAGDDADDARFYRVSARKYLKDLEILYELHLKNGNGGVWATVAETAGKRAVVTSDIASDHSIMIIDCLERLGLIENM